jgi:3-oxoacyl-[acyl-carrier-protein] synthase II
MKPSAQIVITGIGVITPLGLTLQNLWTNILAGKTSVQQWKDLEDGGYRNTHACRIESIESSRFRRGQKLALLATDDAIKQSGIQVSEKTGIFMGSTLGESDAFEYAATNKKINLPDYSVDSFGKSIAQKYQITRIPTAVSTACAAGNYAIGLAYRALKQGNISMAIAGGAEPFSRLAMVGFSRSRAMATQFCQPFDIARTGMLLGEGAAVFVLERKEEALLRGAIPLAEILSLGLSCDAYHPTAPLPDGSGMIKAINYAMDTANVLPHQINWINTHGSGTRLSDLAESKAINEVFKEHLPYCSGSKGALGHSLGASSAIELALCVKGILTKTIPPTFGHQELDPACNIQCLQSPKESEIKYVINSAMAFGGLNSALLIKSCEN